MTALDQIRCTKCNTIIGNLVTTIDVGQLMALCADCAIYKALCMVMR